MAQFIISIAALKRNAAILRQVRDAAGCRLVLALKGFSCWKAFPHIRDDFDGCCASGIWEARLARDHFHKEVVTYSPAFTEEEVLELCGFTTHLDFNSLSQWFRFREIITSHPRYLSGELHCGLRINPEHSTGTTPLYDPCSPGSRLGITAEQLADADLGGLSGLHFHTLCEQNSDDLETTLEAVDQKFGHLLRSPQFTYLNMGGGHWITKPDYDRENLIHLVRQTRQRYDLEVWLEPGEAAAIHAGVLRARVLDVFESMGHRHAILDVSATAHMPDVLEMPYRPEVFLAKQAASLRPDPPAVPAVTRKNETYLQATEPTGQRHDRHDHDPVVHRLAGPTCLAGDIIGDYAFPRPLVPGDTLIFDDMAHYTMVKTTTFNGVKHPSITLQHEDGTEELLREFHYDDFANRLS